MATLRLRNGVYFVDYRVDGVRRRVSTKTSDKKIAQAILKDYDARIAKANHLGVPFDDLKKAETSKSDSSVPVFFRKFTEHCRQRYAPGNLHSDVARINAWRDYFARKSVRYLAQITPAHVNEFNTTVLAGKKPKTLKNHLSLLKTAMNYAVENDWIEENPIRKVKPPKVVSEPNWFTKREIEKLIAEAEEPLKTAIIILANTGLRRGELFHLRWRDIDMKRRVLRVQPHKGFTPKGRKSRSVPLNKRVSGILRRLKQDSKYAYRPYDWDGQLSVQFLSLTRKLGIEGRLHDLRHTFASHLVMEGNPIKAIQELLGHSDIRTTMVYAHLSPEIHKSVVESVQF